MKDEKFNLHLSIINGRVCIFKQNCNDYNIYFYAQSGLTKEIDPNATFAGKIERLQYQLIRIENFIESQKP